MVKVRDDGILYRYKEKDKEKEVLLDWKNVKGLHCSIWTGLISIRGKHTIPLRLPENELVPLVIEFYTRWSRKFPSQAKKNAFDYSEPPKSAAILMIFISLFLCCLLSTLLFVESYTQNFCSQALKRTPVRIAPQVLKAKKKKKGNFALTLQFTTLSGQVLKGKRYTVKTYAPGEDPTEFSIIYASEEPNCWVLSQSPGKTDINWAKRRYMVWFNTLVGIVFLLTGIAGIFIAIRRLTEKRPGRDLIATNYP